MATQSKKSDKLKNAEQQKENSSKKWDLEGIDLGDADHSSSGLGMDSANKKIDKNKLPSEKGRIEEL